MSKRRSALAIEQFAALARSVGEAQPRGLLTARQRGVHALAAAGHYGTLLAILPFCNLKIVTVKSDSCKLIILHNRAGPIRGIS